MLALSLAVGRPVAVLQELPCCSEKEIEYIDKKNPLGIAEMHVGNCALLNCLYWCVQPASVPNGRANQAVHGCPESSLVLCYV